MCGLFLTFASFPPAGAFQLFSPFASVVCLYKCGMLMEITINDTFLVEGMFVTARKRMTSLVAASPSMADPWPYFRRPMNK